MKLNHTAFFFLFFHDEPTASPIVFGRSLVFFMGVFLVTEFWSLNKSCKNHMMGEANVISASRKPVSVLMGKLCVSLFYLLGSDLMQHY